MRKLSLDRTYGCSTAHRNGIIGLPQNRVAFITGSYLIILDCSTGEQRYLSFATIEFLYVSPNGSLMGIIDRLAQDGNTRIHIYSTQPIDLLHVIEPDRFGSFIGITINTDNSILLILHSAPAYMITVQEIQIESDEQHICNIVDMASVRAVHGSVLNRMTKKEIIPHVFFISFCPHSSSIFCATGSALFKLYTIQNQIVDQQPVHFRAEFYAFTCHCWLDSNSILVATEHGHIFWIQEGSIRSDINLQESINVDLNLLTSHARPSRQSVLSSSSSSSVTSPEDKDAIQMLKDDLLATGGTGTRNPQVTSEVQSESFTRLNLLPETTKTPEEAILYLDLFVADPISPYFVVSFQEYILVFAPIIDEPFFQVIARHRLQIMKEHQIDIETNHILKMSSILDEKQFWIYALTDRNQIFRYTIDSFDNENERSKASNSVELHEKHIYGFHAYNLLSIGFCMHKPWLVTLGGDNWIKIIDYKDNNREIISKHLPDEVLAVTGTDPYGLQLCVAIHNRLQLYLITNYELRLMHQYEARAIRELQLSNSGHLIAAIMNNLVKIYSTVDFRLLTQLRGHVGKIKQVVWSKNDSILITCGTDGMIYIFNVFTGMRDGEVITKQFRYLGIAVTEDNSRIYAIASDSSIKIFNHTNLEQEWPIENGYMPSAITLAKSERLLYVGMTHGVIRVYTIPFTFDGFIDLPAHGSSVRQLLVSHDDQYLASIGESAYILLFRHTSNIINSSINEHQFSELSIENLPIGNENRITNYFEYILVTKSEFDEQLRKLKETEMRINEFEMENNLKMRSKQITFNKHLNNYSTKFETSMKQLFALYQQLKYQIQNDQCKSLINNNNIQEKYAIIKDHTEVAYESQMMEILLRIQNMQLELRQIQSEHEKKMQQTDSKEHNDLMDIVHKTNTMLQLKWRFSIHEYEIIVEQEREMKEYIRQMEFDIDDEIENIKLNYENELQLMNANAKQLTITVSTLRKRYNAIVNRMESRDIERSDVEKEVKELYNKQTELIEQLDYFRNIIKKKEDRIGVHDIKLHHLQYHILYVEKRKYVLDYKTKSLLERIEPIDQEILKLKINNNNIEQQLTILKREQKELILHENEYEIKFYQANQQLKNAKKTHEQIWKDVKQQKDNVKRVLQLVETTCGPDSNHSIQEMCNTLRNEQRTENQIEIQGFVKEWNQQRKWLLDQLHDLNNHTELTKQSFVYAQREHHKEIAPFVNQLHDLHSIFNGIQKKIQKRLFQLKIKINEQINFLKKINETIHGNDKLHINMNRVHQNEFLVEYQEKEIQRLTIILFRIPCIESEPINTSTIEPYSISDLSSDY